MSNFASEEIKIALEMAMEDKVLKNDDLVKKLYNNGGYIEDGVAMDRGVDAATFLLTRKKLIEEGKAGEGIVDAKLTEENSVTFAKPENDNNYERSVSEELKEIPEIKKENFGSGR